MTDIVQLLEAKRNELGENKSQFSRRFPGSSVQALYSSIGSKNIKLPRKWRGKAAELLGMDEGELSASVESQWKEERAAKAKPAAKPRRTVYTSFPGDIEYEYFANVLGWNIHSVVALGAELIRKHIHEKVEQRLLTVNKNIPDPFSHYIPEKRRPRNWGAGRH
jgi:hypothetical protein